MKIDIYVTMYNEEQILPYFLRHYETFADNIYVFLDECTDNTREILSKHPKVTIIDVKRHGIDEGYWTSMLWTAYESFSRGFADWVALVDADEFLYHPDLVGVLEREKKLGTEVIQPEGYFMFADKLPKTKGQIYEKIKKGVPDFWATQCCVFDPAIYIRFRYGCHSISRIQRNVIIKSGKELDIKMLHYRWFGREYAEARDKKNFSRFYINQTPPPFEINPRRQLPSRKRGRLYGFVEKYKPLAVNVVI